MKFTPRLVTTVLFSALFPLTPIALSADGDGHPAAGLKLRDIGPASPSGRISQFAVSPASKAHWYVATSSGGLWETRNAGTTWQPLFDRQSVYALGSVTLDPSDPMTLWVGSGENNAQRSVMSGDGVYVSRDGGKRWTNVGLKDSGHISQIHVDPKDGANVLVAGSFVFKSNDPTQTIADLKAQCN